MLKGTDTNYVGTAAAVTGQPTQGLRRRHNFGDRVYKLTPEETPFFAYLNAVGKYPTDDPVFRVLEDRAPTKWADRSFVINGSDADITIEATEGGNWKSASSSTLPLEVAGKSDELVVGMLISATNDVSEGGEKTPRHITGLITAVGTGTIEVQTVDVAGDSDIAVGSGVDLKCQVIGTAWGEGTKTPTSFGYGIDDTQGYTQIFKTSAHMSNTAMATKMRGYSSEWDRTWAMKLREHKVDIERAFLYNAKGIQGGIQYTDGIIGHCIKAGTFVANSSALSYTEGQPYLRNYDVAPSAAAENTEATYDSFLSDFEVIFAPERGGSSQKFCMASLPVVTYMNQLKNGFMSGSTDSRYSYNLDFSSAEGGLGHKVMKVDTVHGSIAIVKNPLLKGNGGSLMVGVDLDNVKYRPLVGNGVNRDTYIETNVQDAGEDSRKDLILTEAGLEVCMPESHFIMNFANNGTRLGQ